MKMMNHLGSVYFLKKGRKVVIHLRNFVFCVFKWTFFSHALNSLVVTSHSFLYDG